MGISATYVSSTQFYVDGDQTDLFTADRRVQLYCGIDGYVYGTVNTSSFAASRTTVTIDESVITSNLVNCLVGAIQSGSEGSLPDHDHSSSSGQGGTLDLDLAYTNQDSLDAALSNYTLTTSIDYSLSLKSNSSHLHDSYYYRQSSVDDLLTDYTLTTSIDYSLSLKSNSSHLHDIYTTQDSLDTALNDYTLSGSLDYALSLKSNSNHLHDSYYYRQSSVDDLLTDYTLTTSIDYSLSLKSDSSHLHDSYYYRQSSVDDLLTDYTLTTSIDYSLSLKSNSSHLHTDIYFIQNSGTYLSSKVNSLSVQVSSNTAHSTDFNNPHSIDEYDILPSQIGNTGKFLTTTGSFSLWDYPSLDYDNSVVVAKDGSADFNTIQGAIDSITDATTNNRYCVLVYPGVYAENIVMKDYVNVKGVGGRLATRVTASSGTLLTMPANEAHWSYVDLYMTPTSNSDKLLDATTGAGSTGQFRVENCHMSIISSAAISPVMIDSNASYGLFLMDDIITYNISNASATGTMIPIKLQSGNDRTYVLRSVINVLTTAAAANIEVIQDNSTGRVLVQPGDFNVFCLSGSYSGQAIFFAQYGGAGSYTHSKQLNSITVTLTSNGNGTGYVAYLDSDSNDGITTISRNTFVVSGFANNYRYYIGTGDTIYSYFNQHASELTDNKVGDLREADIYANDALIISEKIGIGTDTPDASLSIQGGDARIRLGRSGGGDDWDLISNADESFSLYNADEDITPFSVTKTGDITVSSIINNTVAPTSGDHLTNKTYTDTNFTLRPFPLTITNSGNGGVNDAIPLSDNGGVIYADTSVGSISIGGFETPPYSGFDVNIFKVNSANNVTLVNSDGNDITMGIGLESKNLRYVNSMWYVVS